MASYMPGRTSTLPLLQARTLELAVPHLKRLNPPVLPRMASLPQLAPSVPTPTVPSNLPTSLPHAYPTEKEMAEKTSTTPADIIQLIRIGDTVASSMLPATVFVARDFFTCRSLEGSLAFRFVAALGDKLAEECGLLARGFRAGRGGGFWP
jgi:hypothetical protein